MAIYNPKLPDDCAQVRPGEFFDFLVNPDCGCVTSIHELGSDRVRFFRERRCVGHQKLKSCARPTPWFRICHCTVVYDPLLRQGKGSFSVVRCFFHQRTGIKDENEEILDENRLVSQNGLF
jgi:hypothetical protein